MGCDAVLLSKYFLKFLKIRMSSSWSSSLVGFPDPQMKVLQFLKTLGTINLIEFILLLCFQSFSKYTYNWSVKQKYVYIYVNINIYINISVCDWPFVSVVTETWEPLPIDRIPSQKTGSFKVGIFSEAEFEVSLCCNMV